LENKKSGTDSSPELGRTLTPTIIPLLLKSHQN
jgi:hypothetical protein